MLCTVFTLHYYFFSENFAKLLWEIHSCALRRFFGKSLLFYFIFLKNQTFFKGNELERKYFRFAFRCASISLSHHVSKIKKGFFSFMGKQIYESFILTFFNIFLSSTCITLVVGFMSLKLLLLLCCCCCYCCCCCLLLLVKDIATC